MRNGIHLIATLGLCGACGTEPKDQPADSGAAEGDVEAFELPADPAVTGVPVGVRTVSLTGTTLEVWYPASDAVIGEPTETVDFTQFIPASVIEKIGEVSLPLLETRAVRDASIRVGPSPWPVVFFSHGFGGNRLQSIDLTSHLASRGYVVVAADHAGRSFSDLLPCLFSPAVEGCDLSGFGADPGPADLDEALVWVDEMAAGEWVDLIDPELIGVMGHSAGGGSTASWGETQTRGDALMVMAAPGVVERDVPTALFNGTCDGIIPYSDVAAGLPALANGVQVDLLGAGHLAFSDLCALELGRLAEEKLAGRDDLNPALYGGLVQLATDGCDGYEPTVDRDECPDSFLANATSAPLVRGVVTDFFDQHLRGAEPTAFSSENLGFIAGP